MGAHKANQTCERESRLGTARLQWIEIIFIVDQSIHNEDQNNFVLVAGTIPGIGSYRAGPGKPGTISSGGFSK